MYAYTDASGKKHQKWETYPTMEDAKKRKTEIEYNQMTGSFTIPECSTISELLDEYVEDIEVTAENKVIISWK